MWTDFRKMFNHILLKSIQCEPIYSIRIDRTGGQTDMTNLIFILQIFANATKNCPYTRHLYLTCFSKMESHKKHVLHS
jgi:hypothetical protein